MTKLDLGTPYLDAYVEERVIHVRIDRVDRRNAMTLDMYRGVRDATIAADADPEIDAVCIRGTGDWFCVGGDMSGNQEDSAAIKERDSSVNFPFHHMESCRKIVVAAVNGWLMTRWSLPSAQTTSCVFAVPSYVRTVLPEMVEKWADVIEGI